MHQWWVSIQTVGVYGHVKKLKNCNSHSVANMGWKNIKISKSLFYKDLMSKLQVWREPNNELLLFRSNEEKKKVSAISHKKYGFCDFIKKLMELERWS